jgi:Domain of unknown function (DUF4159)
MTETNHAPRRCASPLLIEGTQSLAGFVSRAVQASRNALGSPTSRPSELLSKKRGARQGGVCRLGPFALRAVIVLTALHGFFAPAVGVSAELLRGGRVGWARLITPSSDWAIHSDQDPKLARFIRSETSLNIDPVWYTVDPADLEHLCAYPYVYVKDLTRYSQTQDLDNLREFLRRGGFIFIDPCTAHFTASQAESFVKRHAALYARLLPGTEARLLPANHELFRCYFTVTTDDLFTPDMIRLGAQKPPNTAMYGVYQGDRIISVISVTGLECGWPQTPQRVPGCMKMIVNSYVYAMTR